MKSQSITQNAAAALATQITTGLFTAVLTIYLARALEPEQFGVFALAIGVSVIVKLPADFGISQSAARFVAERRGHAEDVARMLAEALRIKLAVSSAVCLGLVALSGPIADAYDEPTLAWPLRAAAIALFGESLMMLYGGAFPAMARTGKALRLQVVESAVETGASIALVLASATATSATFGRAAGYVAGAIAAVVLTARLVGRDAFSIRHGDPASRRRLATYAGALLIIDGAFAIFQQIDVLLIGAIMTTAAAGLFQAPLRLISFLNYPAAAVAYGVAPRLARGATGGQQIFAFRQSVRYMLILQAALVAPIVVWAGPIVELTLGPDYADSADALRALAPFVFLNGFGILFSFAVNYMGEARRRIPIAIAVVLLNVVLDIVLIQELGIVGAAIGTDVAYAVYVAAHVWICRDLIELPLRPLVPVVARSVLAAGVMAAVLLAVGTTDVGLVEFLWGGLAATAAYCAALLVTREVTRPELALILHRLRTAAGRE